MKKLALSVLVTLAFIAYSYHSRHDGSGVVLKQPPTGGAAMSMQPSNQNTAGSGGTGSDMGSGSGQSPQAGGRYKDGTYAGSVADAFYGNVQVQVTVRSGRIADVVFLQRPNDNPTSRAINAQADPWLTQEAVQAQSAQVDTITGATDTSMAFVQSLTAALSHAG